MRFLRLIPIILLTVFMACGEDEPLQPIGPGPTPPVDDDNDGGGDGGGTTSDPFLYEPTSTLQDLASYPVGMIVSAARLNSSSTVNFKDRLLNDFNSMTAENDMKMANMFTGPDTYDWSDGDDIVAYAKANGLRVHGHALVWHASIPTWLQNFEGTDEEFEAQVEGYVKATVAHFAEEKMEVNGEEVSVVAGWDVVNEGIADGGGIRPTLFSERMGTDYMKRIFQWAREADPDVKLFYNDYNVVSDNSKRSSILSTVNIFNSEGIPIDGIGFQMHLRYNFPSATNIQSAVSSVIPTGLLIHFSEVDVTVNYNDDISELTEERAAAQELMYNNISTAYQAVPVEQQYGITVWGMRDQDSWLWNGGTEWPLMFDNDFNFKISHRGLANGLN